MPDSLPPRARAVQRRACVLSLLGAAFSTPAASASAPARGKESSCLAAEWPLWNAFDIHFVQRDGRVLDASTPQKHSSSEGQSYAMFFALVANQPERFELLWRWSVSNLFGGKVAQRLPGWMWGLAPDGAWRLLDDNSASDADLWFVYSLLEAARLWNRPDFEVDARALLEEVERREVVDLPDLGPMLLPGGRGFVSADGKAWTLNPSYLPLPVLRRLAAASPRGPWGRVAQNTVVLLEKTATKAGFVPDWTLFTTESAQAGRFVDHPTKSDSGSYDAIRTYLWAGMTAPTDPLAPAVLRALHGPAGTIAATGSIPESVSTGSGAPKGMAPFGFSAALVPYLQAIGRREAADRQAARVREALQDAFAPQKVQARQPPYYDVVLSLFGMGWIEGRYRFGRFGDLRPAWKSPCRAIAVH